MEMTGLTSKAEQTSADVAMQNTQREAERLKVRIASVIGFAEVDALLSEVGRRIGADDLALGADGEMELTVEERFVLQLQFIPARKALLASMPLGPVAAIGAKTLEQLFELNLSWHSCGHGVFAVLPESDVVAYATFIDVAHGSADQLYDDLGRLIGTLGKLQTFVDGLDGADADSPDDALRIFL